MKRVFSLLGILLFSVACSAVSPDSGTQAVLTYKPMFFGHGGVEPTPVEPGLTWVAWTTQSAYVNLQPQRVDMKFDDAMTKSGVPVEFHAVVTFRIIDSVKLVTKFGNDTFETGEKQVWPGFFLRNLDQPIRTAIRDEVKNYEMNDIAIQTSAVTKLEAAVVEHVRSIIASTGVPIQLESLSVGRINPPDSIKHQRVETATQEQRIITEQQRKLAEDQRKMAEESKATADAAYNQKINAAGGLNLSPEQYLDYLTIQMKREVCGRNGNCTFIFGSSIPLVEVKK